MPGRQERVIWACSFEWTACYGKQWGGKVKTRNGMRSWEGKTIIGKVVFNALSVSGVASDNAVLVQGVREEQYTWIGSEDLQSQAQKARMQ